MDSVPKMKSVLKEFVLKKNLLIHRLLIVNTDANMLMKFVLMVNAGTNAKSTTYVPVNKILTALMAITAILMVIALQHPNVNTLMSATKECYV